MLFCCALSFTNIARLAWANFTSTHDALGSASWFFLLSNELWKFRKLKPVFGVRVHGSFPKGAVIPLGSLDFSKNGDRI